MSMNVLSEYRSPVSKLLPFFIGNRDRWKAKARSVPEAHTAESVPVGDDSKSGLQ